MSDTPIDIHQHFTTNLRNFMPDLRDFVAEDPVRILASRDILENLQRTQQIMNAQHDQEIQLSLENIQRTDQIMNEQYADVTRALNPEEIRLRTARLDAEATAEVGVAYEEAVEHYLDEDDFGDEVIPEVAAVVKKATTLQGKIEQEDVAVIDSLGATPDIDNITINALKKVFDLLKERRPSFEIDFPYNEINQMSYLQRKEILDWYVTTKYMVCELCKFNRLAVPERELERAGITTSVVDVVVKLNESISLT